MRNIFFSCVFFLIAIAANAQKDYFLLVGTYTNNNTSKGIYTYNFSPKDGSVELIDSTSKISNPSYLAISSDRNFLYSVNEGNHTQGATAFSFNQQTGHLTFLNEQPTDGAAPCYIAIDKTGKNVVTANYNGSNFTVFKTANDGKLLPHVQLVAHSGSGVNKERQEKSHVHQTIFSPDEKYLFVNDLGNDTVYQYPFFASKNFPVDTANVIKYKVPDGLGPRHSVFSPNKQFVYVLTEMGGKVIAYKYGNKLKQLQIISATEAGAPDKGSATIRVTPDGNFLYASNRGVANDIAIFRIAQDGTLTKIINQPVGRHPRDFMIDPTGKFLLVANRDDNNILIFKINKTTGLLENTGKDIHLPAPVGLIMVEKK
ncbi:MAG: lactonase family protein [Chitinophagaceae bacterium]|jgi:6-phosphogluconolactonase|nr:lactonase family protein [Chitinophagaceae bacterium]